MNVSKPGSSPQQPALADADFARLLAFRDGLRSFLHWSEAQAGRAGLTAMQHQLLLVVRGHGSTPTVGDIAAHLLLRHHSVVELIDRAARAGLVERNHDQDDHRSVRVSLTPEGEARLAQLSAAHIEELARLEAVFAPLWAEQPAPVADGRP
jgi:DNA-binding MarR family transcriptional regulator